MKMQSRILIALLLSTHFGLSSRRCSAYTFQDKKQETAPCNATLRLRLSRTSTGIDGYLMLCQDPRLTPKLIDLLWGTGQVDMDGNPDLATFKSNPLRNAAIQLVDRAGKVLAAKNLERPLARLRSARLYGDARLTYLLTVDHSAGFGSYNGPITSLVEVKNGRLRWIESTEPTTGKTEAISLTESLKTTWKLVDAPDREGKQILLAQCRPDVSSVKDDPDFTTQYVRIYFNGTRWLAKVRTVKGLSEFDQGFPNRKNFP